MTPRVAIIAALARELRPLVRGWNLESNHEGVVIYSSPRAIAAFAGMGEQRARLAIKAASEIGPLHRVVSAGWAGGLHHGIRPATVHGITTVIDVRNGETFETAALHVISEGQLNPGATLLSLDRVAGAEEKRHLRQHYRADLVDMEAAAVARFAREAGLPFSAIKAVSDGDSLKLPNMDQFSNADGQFREGLFAAHVALRPALWSSAAKLARASAKSAQMLCAELERYLQHDEALMKA